ncbi:aminotransferase class IV family protein [Mangrovibacterium lignilyticum]|uniref:aminotransferase class IV family protein n=1 Tax=Mangrovibacterium lignilyticum TaxID=2668052 RepID=UPI0013D6CC6A|nr:aminotransferase class IV family protein [Mangrovibacterium lignilyticum]
MCQLLETIKLENGRLFNLKYHNRRMNEARQELFVGCTPVELENEIQVPEDCLNGLYRCRVLYAERIEKIEFIPQHVRSFSSLKLVTHDTIDYHFKYAERSTLNELFAQRGNADEIIIVKNGEITDCTIGNLVFFDGQKWLTPTHPLLNGTQRQKLLETDEIQEKTIHPTDLSSYQKAGIINAFFDLGNMPIIEIEKIS